jgi:hypothetical protein
MVRSAKCSRQDNGFVVAEIKNEGVKWCDRGAFPKRAEFAFAPEGVRSQSDSWEITYIEVRNKADESVVEASRALLRGDYKDATDILDQRGGNTVRRIVGEEPRPKNLEDQPGFGEPLAAQVSHLKSYLLAAAITFIVLLLGAFYWRKRVIMVFLRLTKARVICGFCAVAVVSLALGWLAATWRSSVLEDVTVSKEKLGNDVVCGPRALYHAAVADWAVR